MVRRMFTGTALASDDCSKQEIYAGWEGVDAFMDVYGPKPSYSYSYTDEPYDWSTAVCSEPPPRVFANRAELKAAVDEWIADATAAEAVHGPLPGWDVSRVDDLSWLFSDKKHFNGDISKWDASSVTNMKNTFNNADAFNSELVWDTSKVANMEKTFYKTDAFNSCLLYTSPSPRDS